MLSYAAAFSALKVEEENCGGACAGVRGPSLEALLSLTQTCDKRVILWPDPLAKDAGK